MEGWLDQYILSLAGFSIIRSIPYNNLILQLELLKSNHDMQHPIIVTGHSNLSGEFLVTKKKHSEIYMDRCELLDKYPSIKRLHTCFWNTNKQTCDKFILLPGFNRYGVPGDFVIETKDIQFNTFYRKKLGQFKNKMIMRQINDAKQICQEYIAAMIPHLDRCAKINNYVWVFEPITTLHISQQEQTSKPSD